MILTFGKVISRNGLRFEKMYEILLSREAVKFYQKQNIALKSKLNRAIDVLSTDPISNHQVKKLHGQLGNCYRLRSGDIRIVFEVDHKSKKVLIKAIDHREGIYR